MARRVRGRDAAGRCVNPALASVDLSLAEVRECPQCQRGIVPYWARINVWKCFSCGLLFRNPMPLERDLVELYHDGWTRPLRRRSVTGGTDWDLAQTYAANLANSLGLKDFRGLRVMDFGAGRGAMAAALRRLGADVYVVDRFGCEHLRQKGFRAVRFLEDLPARPFDGIVCIDVIEHLKAPWVEIQRFKELLGTAGWLYLATVNAGGLKARLAGAGWREAAKPVHVVWFTSESLAVTLRRCNYSGWRKLRWFVRYAADPVRACMQASLQALEMDGELRFLAFK